MSDVESSIAPRAPANDGGVFVSPSHDLRKLISANRILLQTDFHVGGLSASTIRKEARTELIQLACNYTRQYKPDLVDPKSTELFFVSGHQPEFFHPGVWFKNFLLSGLAKRFGGIGINLIIDNDECKSTSISVPTGSADHPHLSNVAFDQSGRVLPFENRDWIEPEIAKNFATEIDKNFTVGNVSGLLLHKIWPNVLANLVEADPSSEKTSIAETTFGNRNERPVAMLGQLVAQSRHQVELEYEVSNLEVPLSEVCRGKAFQKFLSAILQSADRFHETYNQAIFDFRSANKIRSKTRPVPELVKNDQWLELPFWIWSRESPERGPLYIRCEKVEHDHCQIFLSDLNTIELKLRSDSLVDELSRLNEDTAGAGIAIRPRALVTTMFARLFLSDVFVHGIGGAKYDELTDEIIRGFFNIEPPAFITATSSNWLPVDYSPPNPTEIAEAKKQIRRTMFHPEKFECDSETFAELSDRKRDLLANIPEKRKRKRWHRDISSVNHQLSELIREDHQRAESLLKSLLEQVEIAKILCSREYSFLLHPVSLIEKLSKQVDEVLINAD